MLSSKVLQICSVALIFAVVSSAPAHALTGGEVMENFDDESRFAYLAGSVEMAAVLTFLDGHRERSACIMDWFFEGNGVAQIEQALAHFHDRSAHPVMLTLINRVCGE